MVTLSAAERDRLIESIVRDHPDLARDRTLLVQFLDAKGWAENALQVFEYLNLVRVGGLLARLQGALAMFSFPGLSEVAFIVDTLAKIGEANLYAVRMLGQKAYAYGVTAWAFQHPMPPLPAGDAAKLREWSSEHRVQVGASEWARMGEAAMTAMLRRCTYHKIQSSDFKLLVRITFRNQPKLLADAVYRGFETGMTAFDRGAHQSLRCDYPGQERRRRDELWEFWAIYSSPYTDPSDQKKLQELGVDFPCSELATPRATFVKGR